MSTKLYIISIISHIIYKHTVKRNTIKQNIIKLHTLTLSSSISPTIVRTIYFSQYNLYYFSIHQLIINLTNTLINTISLLTHKIEPYVHTNNTINYLFIMACKVSTNLKKMNSTVNLLIEREDITFIINDNTQYFKNYNVMFQWLKMYIRLHIR